MSRDEDDTQKRPDDDPRWSPDDDLFDEFDDDAGLDEPDRDSDAASMYHEDDLDEIPPYFDDPPESGDDAAGASPATTPWDTPPPATEERITPASPMAGQREQEDDALEDDANADDPWGDPADTTPGSGATLPPLSNYPPPQRPGPTADDDADDIDYFDDDEDDYDDYPDEAAEQPTLPLGLIIVGVLALALLGAGGYGVLEQRAALQEEVRQLQSQLATAASPAEVTKTRANAEALQLRNDELEARLVSLERENRALQSTVAGLEKQLAAQQEALQKSPPPAAPVPQPVTRPAPKPIRRSAAPASAPPAADSGDWFVNFGSYGQEAAAQAWAERLQPDAGRVVVITGEKDGRTFYRVRVVGLASRDAANSTARALERKYGLERLWVGESG